MKRSLLSTIVMLSLLLTHLACDEIVPSQTTDPSQPAPVESLDPATDTQTESRDSATDSGSTSAQPYEAYTMWTWNAPINGPGWCGPAALYHVINYFGDHGFYFYRNLTLSGWKWGSDMIEIEEIYPADPVYMRDTQFGRFIQPEAYGSGWSLLDNVANLYYSKSPEDQVYEVFVCSSFTKAEEVAARKARLDYILENLLRKNIPVVIHLTSAYLGLGHYVTLIGYDPEKGEVYYVDSIANEGILVAEVTDFLSENFYGSGLAYSARWDGEWLAFWHPDDEIQCDQCGDS